MIQRYALIRKSTGEAIRHFDAPSDPMALVLGMQYLMGLGLTRTRIKQNFKVIGVVSK